MNRHHHPRNWLMKACFGIAFIVFGLIVVAGLTTIGSTQIAPSETRVCHQQQFIELLDGVADYHGDGEQRPLCQQGSISGLDHGWPPIRCS